VGAHVAITKVLTMYQIIRNSIENLYSDKLENLGEIDKFLDTNNHPKLNEEDINHLKIFMKCNEIEAAKKSFTKKKSPGLTDSPLKSNRLLKKN
jgi:hypothetical protein